jgi:hypothetical protein
LRLQPVLGRSELGGSFEDFVKVGHVVKTAIEANVVNAFIGDAKQGFGQLDALGIDKIHRRYPELSSECPEKVGLTHMGMLAELVDRKGIVEVIPDKLDHGGKPGFML